MPNWCKNSVTFSHPNTTQIARVVAAFNQEKLMSEFFPCPEDLNITSGYLGAGTPEQAELEALQAANLAKYGFKDWYDWKISNWGTKWDCGEKDGAEYTDGDTSVTLNFGTAWSPPIEFYEQMQDAGFEVDALYYEPGVSFCGRYSEDGDAYYNITGDSDWVDDNIPPVINRAFAIAENMSEWEQTQGE